MIYVDETGIDTYLYRQHCYAKTGEKVIGYVYGRKYIRVGIVAAQMEKKIISPCRYKGTMNNGLKINFYESFLLKLL